MLLPVTAYIISFVETIGILNTRFVFDYPTLFYMGASKYAQSAGINLLSINGGAYNHPDSYMSSSTCLFDLAHSSRIDGLIILMAQVGMYLSEEDKVKFVKGFDGIPITIIGEPMEGRPTIGIDNAASSYIATEHLIKEHGHQKILYIRGPSDVMEAKHREEGFLQCLKDHNIDQPPERKLRGSFITDSGFDAMENLLLRGDVRPGRDFTAVMAASDAMAWGAMDSLIKHGIRVPEDIACVGFDDRYPQKDGIPLITTNHYPLEEMGRKAVEITARLIAKENVPNLTIVDAPLVVRDSCGCKDAEVWLKQRYSISLSHKNWHSMAVIALKKINLICTREDVERLEQSFREALKGETKPYYTELRDFLKNIVRYDSSTRKLSDFLDNLGLYVKHGEVGMDERIEGLISISKNIASENIAAFADSRIYRMSVEFRALRRINVFLKSIDPTKNMGKKFQKRLAAIGISYASIVLFNQEGPHRRNKTILSTHFSDSENPLLDDFSYYDIFPPGLSPQEPYVAVIEPLWDGENPLGYLLISRGLHFPRGYDHFSNLLSSTLENILAREKVTNKNRELSQALSRVEEAKRQLFDAEKLASLGRLVAGLSHEINTPLGNAVTLSSLLEEEFSFLCNNFDRNSERQKKELKELEGAASLILQNVQRAAELVESLKTVSAGQTGDRIQNFELGHLLKDVIKSHSQKLKKLYVTLNVPESGIPVSSYPGVFSQILSNLLNNSVLHGFSDKTKGRIEIDISLQNEGLTLRYQDTGDGMSLETLQHIYDPFFTTRFGQGGSGMGMYFVYTLVTARLGGHIKCSSSPGEGVEFIIEVPLIPPEVSDSSF